jgi:peptide/nickel transport system substrate-binding protein
MVSKKDFFSVIPVFLIGFFLFVGCSRSDSGAGKPQAEKVITIALGSAWENLNTFHASGDYKGFAESLIFDRLATLNDNKGIVPGLLSSWEFSADGLVLTGKINEKAKWHDGVPVTAADVVFTYESYTHPDVTAPRFSLVVGTTDVGVRIPGEAFGVKAVDEHTVEFILKEHVQDVIFFDAAAYQFILPKHLLEKEDPATFTENPFFEKPIGSGPVIFVNQTIGTELNGTANKNYHLGTPDFDKLILRVIPNDKLLAGLLSGEIDAVGGAGLSNLPYSDYVLAKSAEELTAYSSPYLGSQFAILNAASPSLKDARVRRAIEKAINKQSMVDNLFYGEASVADSPISRLSTYYNKNLVSNQYNPAQAKAELDAAGFDYSRPIVITCPSGNTQREQSAVLIQQDLAAVGVTVKIDTVDFPTLMNIAFNHDLQYDIILMGRGSSICPSTFKGYYNTYTGSNFARMSDSSIYDTFFAAERALNAEDEKRLYNEAQQLCSDAATYIYLYSANNLVAYQKNITGIDYAGAYVVNNIWEWKIN